MNLDKIKPLQSNPDDINVVIEIPAHSSPVKYEVDKDSGALMVDRFMTASMVYPCNYGFIPNTLADDGDPMDVLVVAPLSVQAGCVMRCRVIGMLQMTDEAGGDTKLLALPIKKGCQQYAHIDTIDDMPELTLKTIKHFFEHYKDLEEGKWVKVENWLGVEEAKKEIQHSIDNYKG